MKYSFLLISVCGLLCSCTSLETSSSIAPNVDFSKYSFAAIGSDVSGGSSIMDAQMQIQNVLISCGYTIIGDTRIHTLSDEEKSKVFIVTMGRTITGSYRVSCTLNITDYVSGYLLASCKSNYYHDSDLITRDKVQIVALDHALAEMEKLIRGVPTATSSNLKFPSNFIGPWKRENFDNTLTFTTNSIISSSSESSANLISISGDLYTFSYRSTTFKIGIKIVNDNIEISGGTGSGQGNWNGTWKKQQ
jgi:hypothetical protein